MHSVLTRNGRILVIDDIPDNVRVLTHALNGEHEVFFALDGERGVQIAREKLPDLILLDAVMPGMDGFQVCQELRSRPATADIPIIFVTAIGRPEDEARAFDVGALDFINKPINPAVVRARVRTHLALSRLYKDMRETVAERTRELTLALAEAEAARAEAERANQAKSRFLATLSHELRTPLNAIIGFSQMLLEEPFGPLGAEPYRGYLADVEQSGEHLLALVNDLLDLSRIEAGNRSVELASVDAVAVVADCTRLLDHRACSAGVTLSAHLPTEPTLVRAERKALKQVLLNIIDNAIKFTPSGGRATVSVQRFGDRILFEVADTGIGIGADNLARVCDPFVQVERELGHGYHSGAGLGLSISKALVDLQGGVLNIASEPARGTVVGFSLPQG